MTEVTPAKPEEKPVPRNYNPEVIQISTEVVDLIHARVSKIFPEEKEGHSRWSLIGRITLLVFNRHFRQVVKVAEESLSKGEKNESDN